MTFKEEPGKLWGRVRVWGCNQEPDPSSPGGAPSSVGKQVTRQFQDNGVRALEGEAQAAVGTQGRGAAIRKVFPAVTPS